jgi:hypothetical protein
MVRRVKKRGMQCCSPPSGNALPLLAALVCLALNQSAFAAEPETTPTIPFKPTQIAVSPDRAAGLQAFAQMQRVLEHPRCLNCHVPDSPLQGIEKRIHYPAVQRGVDGRGVAPMQCSTCHSIQNGVLLHSPPGLEAEGKSAWRMPPAKAKMNWVGLDTSALCKAIRNPKENNGKSLAELEKHMLTDHLVLWGWHPGPGRELPPLDKAAFDNQVSTWIRNGAPCDESEPLRKSVGTIKAAAQQGDDAQAISTPQFIDDLRTLAPYLITTTPATSGNGK